MTEVKMLSRYPVVNKSCDSCIMLLYHRYTHPRVVQIMGVCISKALPAMVMERMNGKSLMDHLRKVLLLECSILRST